MYGLAPGLNVTKLEPPAAFECPAAIKAAPDDVRFRSGSFQPHDTGGRSCIAGAPKSGPPPGSTSSRYPDSPRAVTCSWSWSRSSGVGLQRRATTAPHAPRPASPTMVSPQLCGLRDWSPQVVPVGSLLHGARPQRQRRPDREKVGSPVQGRDFKSFPLPPPPPAPHIHTVRNSIKRT